MNWETEQIQHVIAGNFNREDYIHWSAIDEDLYLTSGRDEEKATKRLAEILEEKFVEGMPITTEPYTSILQAGIEQIGWEEVAESILDEFVNADF